MKKVATTCIVLYTIMLITTSIIPAAKASISSHNWIGALMRNSYDSFYGTYITAYEGGTTARLVVNVYSDYWYMGEYSQVNVSAVIVGFEWGENFSSTEASLLDPWEIPYGESHVFTLTFTVPSASVVSNFVTHSYTIYVEHVDGPNGTIVDTWTTYGSGFAVFSSNQADAFIAKRELESYPYMYIPFFTATARDLATQSSVAKSMGYNDYVAGNFGSAETHYENALLLLQKAYSNETERWGAFEDTFEGLLKGAENLLVYQGYTWLIIGIGFFLMGIGVVVYLVRKSGTPKAS